MQEKPVLYVDVDGVISLWGFDPNNRPPGAFTVVDGIPHFLSEEAGAHLLDLSGAFALVWCTGWEEKANEHLLSPLALPNPLPYLSFDAHRGPGHTTPGHWKLGAIDEHAGDRPVAWVDDALNDACREWARSRPAPTLLLPTDPAVGLVATHAERLREFAAAVAPAGA
ncbi:MAG TPA: hypothetical protein VHF89_00635 [Solirubrobacteraceae bacterium]|nr:hypothetical protein [Solirubrobacteraceae bacterium]